MSAATAVRPTLVPLNSYRTTKKPEPSDPRKVHARVVVQHERPGRWYAFATRFGVVTRKLPKQPTFRKHSVPIGCKEGYADPLSAMNEGTITPEGQHANALFLATLGKYVGGV